MVWTRLIVSVVRLMVAAIIREFPFIVVLIQHWLIVGVILVAPLRSINTRPHHVTVLALARDRELAARTEK